MCFNKNIIPLDGVRSYKSVIFYQELRTRLDLLKPDVSSHVSKHAQYKVTHDQYVKAFDFAMGTEVPVDPVPDISMNCLLYNLD